MSGCPFCDLGAGSDEDLVAHRTPRTFVVAVTRQRAANRGHVLVLPTTHVERLSDADPALLAELFSVAGRVSRAMRTVLGAAGATIFQNDGTPDQVLHHVHVHVVPRHPGDGFRLSDPDKADVGRDERRAQADALRRALEPG